MKNDFLFDVVVIGGGHAGCEAATASARLGVNTALFTLNLIPLEKCHVTLQLEVWARVLSKEIDTMGHGCSSR